MSVNFGAGKQTIDFSAPNPQPMERLRVAAERLAWISCDWPTPMLHR